MYTKAFLLFVKYVIIIMILTWMELLPKFLLSILSLQKSSIILQQISC